MTDLYIEEFLTHLEHDPNYNLYDLDNSISMDDLINYRKNSLFENYNELIDLLLFIIYVIYDKTKRYSSLPLALASDNLLYIYRLAFGSLEASCNNLST
jgi:hypothetical protein